MKMYKILIMVLLSMVMSTGVLASNQDIKINVNGTMIHTDVSPIVINGITLVPVRAVSEIVGAEVKWYPPDEFMDGTVMIVSGGKSIYLYLGDKTAMVNEKGFQLEQPPIIVNGRTMVPLRFIGESLGMKVDWDGKTKTVILNTSSMGVGAVKGKLAYKPDSSYSLVPEQGAKVMLIPMDLKKNIDDRVFLIFKQTPQGKDNIYTTETDYDGNYEIKNVKEGEYFIIMKSEKVMGNAKVEERYSDILKKLLSNEGWRYLEMGLKTKKHGMTPITVKDKETTEVPIYPFF